MAMGFSHGDCPPQGTGWKTPSLHWITGPMLFPKQKRDEAIDLEDGAERAMVISAWFWVKGSWNGTGGSWPSRIREEGGIRIWTRAHPDGTRIGGDWSGCTNWFRNSHWCLNTWQVNEKHWGLQSCRQRTTRKSKQYQISRKELLELMR